MNETVSRPYWPTVAVFFRPILSLLLIPMAARLLGFRVRITPGTWKSVSSECRVLSGRGLCVGLITRPGGPTECGVSN
jgi:hypothetical protein